MASKVPAGYYRDFRQDGCPSDSRRLIGDDMAFLLDSGIPYDHVERPQYCAYGGACRVYFALSLPETVMLGYSASDYESLFSDNGLSPQDAADTMALARGLGFDAGASASSWKSRAASPRAGLRSGWTA